MTEMELYNLLMNLPLDTSKPIPEFMKSYVLNYNGLVGVAVESQYAKDIKASFNNVTLAKVNAKRDGANRDVIFLYVKKSHVNSFFIKLCYDFLKDSELVSSDPVLWYEGWTSLVGNSKIDKMVYDVVSELKILLFLQNCGQSPFWNSTECSTFDISATNAFYEVKSSQNKTSDVITIHNQYQLDSKGLNKPLYIAYCKVEKNDSGDSINSLCEQLKSIGYENTNVEAYLNKLGYYPGNNDRDRKYLFHEIRLYNVDPSFPKIIDSSFKNDKFPDNIIKIEYSLSLEGLEYQKII